MPRLRLTEQMIQSAKGTVELWDTDVSGLFLRVQPRKKTWGLRYVFAEDEVGPASKRRDHLGVYPGLGLYDAREKARCVLRELEQGRDPRVPAGAPCAASPPPARRRSFSAGPSRDPERVARDLARAVFSKLSEALPKPFRLMRDLGRTMSRFVPRGE